MQKRKCSFLVLAFLCLSLLIHVSCATKYTGTKEGRKDRSDSSESRQMKESAKALEPQVKEEEVTADNKVETASLAVPKEDNIDQNLLSEIQTFEATRIYFDFDKADLKPEAQAALKRLADWLQANPRYTVLIEGHGDERGPSGYNLALGETRAIAAEKYLQLLGIEADRISTISYGEEKPADPGKNETAWAKNRRDEFKLTRKP